MLSEREKSSFLRWRLAFDSTLLTLREALRAGGAKNDRWDCRLQAELVKHFHHLLPVWRPDDVLTRKLAALCEGRRKAVNTRTGLGQEIKAQLKASFPFALASCLRATARAL